MDAKQRVSVVVAAHKPYRMPKDPMYLPLHVGAAGKPPIDGYRRDDAGENISEKNPSFCELTGLYWAWKNLDADYIGLAHYRRHFGLKKGKDPWERIITREDLAPYLGRIRAFVPKKRRYYIETLYSHYAHTHYAAHLDTARAVLAERCPEYLNSFDRVARRTWGYMFNMMILERGLLCDYCAWLFDLLFTLERRLGNEELSAFQGRFYGRVSEIVFNVWLDRQIETGRIRRDEIMELPVVYTEKTNLWKKGTAFLRAKFFGRKYEGSF